MMNSATFQSFIDITKPFAMIEKRDHVVCYQGQIHALDKLQDIHDLSEKAQTDIVFVLPYRVIRERGFEAKGDEPILAIAVERSVSFRREDFLSQLPDDPIALRGGVKASVGDNAYADMVAALQKKEIEGGNTSQTILSRHFSGDIDTFDIDKILSIYKRLLTSRGQYMTVLFADIDDNDFKQSRFIVGATPERHLEVTGNETVMIPIAGTLRKADGKGAEDFEQRLAAFLNDPKEINELFQVMDEEMKLMGTIAPEGGTINGPFMREIGAVVHTEYELVGKRCINSIDALRLSVHAPTVVGSPMESAARIIDKYEPESRRYYSGEFGLYTRARDQKPNGDLDTAILIRCAEIDGGGHFRIQAGGGIVRDSSPQGEAQESYAKAMGMLGILTGESVTTDRYLTPDLHAKYTPLLQSRNQFLSPFWQNKQNKYESDVFDLGHLKITIVNNEDDFAHMIGHMVRTSRADVRVVDTFEYQFADDDADIIILGPGPGDPNDREHPRMKKLHEITHQILGAEHPVLGICLGHQVISIQEGLIVKQQTQATQGMQRDVTVWGKQRKLGFYNSFSPVLSGIGDALEAIQYDLDDEERIVAMKGEGFTGFQFHPESVMSFDGYALLCEALLGLSNHKSAA